MRLREANLAVTTVVTRGGEAHYSLSITQINISDPEDSTSIRISDAGREIEGNKWGCWCLLIP
jgi:hypothetical protein